MLNELLTKLEGIKVQSTEQISQSTDPSSIKSAKLLRDLYSAIPKLEGSAKAQFGKAINSVKVSIDQAIDARRAELESQDLDPIDVTAPLDVNADLPSFLSPEVGSIHPLIQEINQVSRIFSQMGFTVEESREIDDQFHMFESLNFPKDHPARDEYDTFMTKEKDAEGEPFIAPAHTSTMQNRTLEKYKNNLVAGKPIAAIVPDRVFRNEDLDARHEHTFYQVEGVYVDKEVNVGNLISTLQTFLSAYYGKWLEIRINPFYFPFTEPSFEFALECPFCNGKDSDCRVCSGEGWIELLGCGLIHPNVMRHSGIDPEVYSGFAFGCGIERLVMIKHGIEDIRHFKSGKLEFLRQF